MRYLVYCSLRRDQLCDPALCTDTPEDGRCDHCPLDRLDAPQSSEPGLLLRRALDLRAARKVGVKLSPDEIPADEFYAMIIIENQFQLSEQERLSGLPGGGVRKSP